MADKRKVVINRGQRRFDLRPFLVPDGKDAEGKTKFKEVPRTLEIGGSIECLDEAEENQLLAHFREIADADNVVPANAKKIDDLQAQIDRLTAANKKLQGDAAAEKAPEDSKKKGR